MSQTNTEEQGITLGQICKVMFYNKIRFLIALLATTIAVCLIMILGYNRISSNYIIKFTYQDYYIANGKYLDGSPFDMRDLYDYLDDVKETSSEYANIDVDKINKNNDVVITNEVETREINDEESIIATYYQLSISSKYFSSKEQATSFLVDLINYPVLYSNDLLDSLDFEKNLNLYDDSLIYSSQISYLESQKSLILSGYESLISIYGDLSIKDSNGNDVKLSTRASNINLYFDNEKLSSMSSEIKKKGFVKKREDYKEYYETEIYNLNLEYEVNKKKIEALEEQRSQLLEKGGTLQNLDLSTYNDQIISLTNRNIDIDNEITIIKQYLGEFSEGATQYTEAERLEFEERLEKFKVKLEVFTEEYKQCYKEILTNYKIVYRDVSKVSKDGDLSIIIILVLGVIAGCCVAGCLNLYLDRKMFAKENEITQ